MGTATTAKTPTVRASTTKTAPAAVTAATMLSQCACGQTHQCQRRDSGKKSIRESDFHSYYLDLTADRVALAGKPPTDNPTLIGVWF
jgi:hypothetical protein